MVRMINAWTKTEMFVAEDRIEKYKAAGCILAADSVTADTEPVKEKPKKAEPKAEPKKATTRKAPAKRIATNKK